MHGDNGMKKFDEIFEDKTKAGTKIPTSEYCKNGKKVECTNCMRNGGTKRSA